MTYRELIHLYKTGKLDEEQKEKVAKDIDFECNLRMIVLQ